MNGDISEGAEWLRRGRCFGGGDSYWNNASSLLVSEHGFLLLSHHKSSGCSWAPVNQANRVLQAQKTKAAGTEVLDKTKAAWGKHPHWDDLVWELAISLSQIWREAENGGNRAGGRSDKGYRDKRRPGTHQQPFLRYERKKRNYECASAPPNRGRKTTSLNFTKGGEG